ncbi:hypothetical protein DQ04_10131020 [Trypanosoma grayi]|uniref:hypothetical protein n=1 Tax=Trypanosoma grayi TaxID=71804 RepID=UPI0004F46A95|nr:hypothetical protein DQ04_10131020 [Trypanosoma grayi]KEG07337.1 hypothetical protein DQ04_10131020 [Trypanosoma grayi]
MTVTVRHVLFVLSLALCCACGCVAAVQQNEVPGIRAQLPSPLQPQLLSDIDVPAEYTAEKIRSEADEGMKVIQEALKRAQQASAEATRLYKKASGRINAAETKSSGGSGGTADSLEARRARDVLYPAHSAKRAVDREFGSLQEINTVSKLAHDKVLADLNKGEAKREEAFIQMETIQSSEWTAIKKANIVLHNAGIVVDVSLSALKELSITEVAKPLPDVMVPRVIKMQPDVPGSADMAGRDGAGFHMWVCASLFLVVAAYAAV